VSRLPRAVAAALERWEDARLLTAAQVATLRAEAAAHAGASGRRGFQYVLAITGGAVVLIAAGVFADWAWPQLGDSGRSVALMAAGFVVHFVGLQVEHRERWRPAGYLLQTTGLLILLGAFLYSERPWPDVSGPAVAIGIACLVLPLVLAYRSVGRDPFMPAVHVALGFAFLAVFLDRATPLSDDAIVWTLDAVVALVVAGLVLRLRRARGEPEEAWALNAFVAALYSGLVVVVFTAIGPLDLSTDTVWAMDLWLAVVVALTLWGIHRAPPALQRGWFGGQLALSVLFAIPLAFFSVLEGLELESTGLETEAAALVVGAVGALAMTYGLAREERSVLIAGCAALLAGAWYYGIDRGGALGAVAALAATAALLFWLSARLGRRG
jgi:hypothetical protein